MSSGKSSVLESRVPGNLLFELIIFEAPLNYHKFTSVWAYSFFNILITLWVVNAGIVTRRPLVLQLQHTDKGQQEYAELGHMPRRKFTDFESHVDLKSQEVKSKDDKILENEKITKEKLDTIASLRSEIASVQKKGTSVTEEQLAEAHAWAADLEKQVSQLRTKKGLTKVFYNVGS